MTNNDKEEDMYRDFLTEAYMSLDTARERLAAAEMVHHKWKFGLIFNDLQRAQKWIQEELGWQEAETNR